MFKEIRIRFQGNEYLLIGTLDEGGAIATKEQYESFACSHAHLCEDGNIRSFHEVIGGREDIEIIGECEAEFGGANFGRNLMAALGPDWANTTPDGEE